MIPAPLKAHLSQITDTGPYLAAGVACCRPGGEGDAFLTGRLRPGEPARDLSHALPARLRVASVSKTATARAMAALVCEGVISLDDPVHGHLAPFGFPAWLGDPAITIAALLSHTSGLRDRAGYFTDPPDDLPAFLTRNGKQMQGGPSGHFFYANLNYVLAAAVIEAASGQRFDRVLADRVLKPLTLEGGFNWAGVTDRHRLPLYQRIQDGFAPRADDEDGEWDADLIWRNGTGIDLASYRLVRDTHLFSPHAGLRLTLPEMARLAAALGDDSPEARLCRQPLWTYDGANGAWSDGLFPNMGLGLTTYRGHDRIPGHLTGHAGHALGFSGGIWCDMETGTGWAYALTGAADETEGQDEEAFFNSAELAIFQAI